MTIKEAAQSALLLVQDAVNLSGILASLNTIVQDVLWVEARRLGKGTEYVNTSPIVTLFLDKLSSLNHSECLCSDAARVYSVAYDEVEKLAAAPQLGAS